MLTTLFESRELVISSDSDAASALGLLPETESGLAVNELSAMRLAAVYSCIYVLSSSLAQLPLHVLRKTKDSQGRDMVNSATDHAAYYLLHDEPNPWQTSYEWRETKMNHEMAWGNGFTEIKRRPRTGELFELKLHDPWVVNEPQRGQQSGRWLYPVWDDDELRARAVRPEDMIHIKAFTSKRKWGVSPIRQHAETVGLGLAAQAYGAQFFGSGGRPSGILINKTPSPSKDARQNLRTAWQNAGIGKGGGRTALLHGDLDYKPITISPEEAQFLETRKFTRSEIAGIFNIPAHMINDLEKATFSNISEQAIQFVRHSIMPHVVKHEQELNRKIFTKEERQAGYYIKFNLAGLLRGTPKERAEFYHYGITDGWMSRQEARAFEDMNPIDGLDEMLVSVNAQKPTEQDTNQGDNTDE